MIATTDLCRQVLDAVVSVAGEPPVGLHPPVVQKGDVMSVMDQLRHLDNYEVMSKFESDLAFWCGRKHAVLTSSGTAALELALATVGVGPGDFVAVPAISFVAAANAVRHRGAHPMLVDVKWPDLGIDPDALEDVIEYGHHSHKPIRAIIAVHILGHPCSIQTLVRVAKAEGIPLIEDAAEALGSITGLEPCGKFGDVSVVSFNLNKIVTAGGGGAVLMDDSFIEKKVRHLCTTARVPHPFLVEHDSPAWNHRMAMLSAALGVSQLKRLGALVDAKRALAEAYKRAFEPIEDVDFHDEPLLTRSNYWLPSIIVPEGERDPVLTALHAAGFGCRALFTPINQLPPYRRDGFDRAAHAHDRIVCLPGGNELAERFK